MTTDGHRLISDCEILEVSFMPYVNEAYGVFPIEMDDDES